MRARFRRGLFLATVLLLLLSALFLRTGAVEEDLTEEFFKEQYGTLSDILPPSLPDPADPDAFEEALTPDSLWETLKAALGQAMPPLGKTAGALLCLVVAFLLLRSLLPGEGGMGETALLLAAGLFLGELFLKSLSSLLAWITDITELSEGLCLLYGGIYTAGGSPGAAAALGGGLATFCGITSAVTEGLLSPLFRFLAALCLLSPLGNRSLASLGESLRGICLLAFGLFSALLPAAVGFQTALASARDTMAARTAKYALGSSIPLVGGALAGTLGTLSSALGLLRQTVGGGAFLGILALSLPPLLQILLLRFLLSLAASLAKALELPALHRQFSEWRGIYDLLLAAGAAVCVTLLLLLAVLSRTTLAIE